MLEQSERIKQRIETGNVSRGQIIQNLEGTLMKVNTIGSQRKLLSRGQVDFSIKIISVLSYLLLIFLPFYSHHTKHSFSPPEVSILKRILLRQN